VRDGNVERAAVRILVTGAAGYIGSVVTEALEQDGHDLVALDNLVHGHRAALPAGVPFVQTDLEDASAVAECLGRHPVDAVMHLAAEALIEESNRDPGRFYRVNVGGGINLLDAMVGTGVNRLVFSSTAAVYGEAERSPIAEDVPCSPVNAYGESKLAFERALAWYRRAHGLRYVVLRYFNACGATERHGEWHVPETHLIPLVFDVAMRRRESLQLYGADYPTPDGTCVRDYIHVLDIARAHVAALEQIDRVQQAAYNLGNGAGYSNRQVIETVKRVTGRSVRVVEAERRPGDPARLVASAQRVRGELGWEPKLSDLETMVESAWAWRQRHPEGYAR
jgi:UDP-glucose 4-epimerase